MYTQNAAAKPATSGLAWYKGGYNMIDEKKFNYALASLDKAGQHQKTTKDKSYYYGMLTMLQIIVSDGWKNDVFVRRSDSGSHYIFDKTAEGRI